MGIETYFTHVMSFFKEHFIENKDSSQDELSSEIRSKLMLMEDPEQRKKFISLVLEEIEDMSLIRKYNTVYGQSDNQSQEPNSIKDLIQHLTYDFKRMI